MRRLWLFAEPLDLHNEHAVIGRVIQKGYETFVVLAGMESAQRLGRVRRLAGVRLVLKRIDDNGSVHELGQGCPDSGG